MQEKTQKIVFIFFYNLDFSDSQPLCYVEFYPYLMCFLLF